jgi:hypothetical protein
MLLSGGLREIVSRGLKPRFLADWNVQAKAWTYLRSKDKGKNKNKCRSRFPAGMTTRRAREEASSYGNDNKKGKRRSRFPTE